MVAADDARGELGDEAGALAAKYGLDDDQARTVVAEHRAVLGAARSPSGDYTFIPMSLESRMARRAEEIAAAEKVEQRKLDLAAARRREAAEIRAPPLDDGEPLPAVRADLVGGNSYSKNDYTTAGKLYARNKLTIQGVEKHASLKRTRAYRIYRQFKAGAVLFDDVGLRPGPGYRWDPLELDNDPPRYRLIHS